MNITDALNALNPSHVQRDSQHATEDAPIWGLGSAFIPTESQEIRIAPAQIAAARALLRWTRKQLARQSGVSVDTIKRFEACAGKPHKSSVFRMVDALVAGGVEFLEPDDEVGPGVRLARCAY